MADQDYGIQVPPSIDYSSGQAVGATEVVAQLQGVVVQLSALVKAFKGRPTFGSFTMPAAATFVVNQAGVLATSTVILVPTNTSAATLMGSAKFLYTSVITPGVSFTVATANATNAVGTETFNYVIQSPV